LAIAGLADGFAGLIIGLVFSGFISQKAQVVAINPFPTGVVASSLETCKELLPMGQCTTFDKAGGRVIIGTGLHSDYWLEEVDKDRKEPIRVSNYAVFVTAPPSASGGHPGSRGLLDCGSPVF